MKFCELKLESLPYFLFKDYSHSSGASLSFSDSEAHWFPREPVVPWGGGRGGGCVCWLLSHVWVFVTPWIVAFQTALSLEFSRQETGVGCHFLLQGIFQTKDWTQVSTLQADSLPLSHQGSPNFSPTNRLFFLWVYLTSQPQTHHVSLHFFFFLVQI